MPFLKSEGSVVINGKVVDIVGDATFIHAIQGMRPDSVSLPQPWPDAMSILRHWSMSIYTDYTLMIARFEVELWILHHWRWKGGR